MRKIAIFIFLALGFTFIGCGENGRDATDEGNNDPLSQLLQSDNQEEKK
jgi:hypothetical protein